jgi:hypothetical protein
MDAYPKISVYSGIFSRNCIIPQDGDFQVKNSWPEPGQAYPGLPCGITKPIVSHTPAGKGLESSRRSQAFPL